MPLAVGMENYTEQRFHHSLTPSFTNCDHGNIMIVFNRDWVYDRIDNHYDDVQFFMLHELRHANQFVQIMQLEQGEATQEPPLTIHFKIMETAFPEVDRFILNTFFFHIVNKHQNTPSS